MSAISNRVSKLEILQASRDASSMDGMTDRQLMRIVVGDGVSDEELEARMAQLEVTGVIPWDGLSNDGGTQ